MERRPRPAVNGMRDSARYGGGSAQGPPGLRHEAPQYPSSRPGPSPGEAPPRVYHPDGGPWEGRPPYNARPHGRAEHRDSRVDEPQQHGGRRPGMPPRGPVLQEILSRPSLPHMHGAEELYGSGGLQAPIIPDEGAIPNIPQRRAPEPPHGMMPYIAPRDGTQQSLTQGRPQYGAPHGVMPPGDGTPQLLTLLGRPQQRASGPPQGVMPSITPQDGNRAQSSGRPYNRATEPPQDLMSYNVPRDGNHQVPTSGRPLPTTRAPEFPQGVMPYDAPRDGTLQPLIPGRPLPHTRAPELPQGVIPYDALRGGTLQPLIPGRPLPHTRAPEPPQGVIPYDAPQDGTPQSLISGRPLPHTRKSESPQGVIPYDVPRDGTPQMLISGRPQPHTRVSEAPQGVIPYDSLRDGTLQPLIPGRPLPHSRVSESPQGVIPYDALRDVTPKSLIPGRPQPHTRVSEAPQGVIPYDDPRDGTLQPLIPGRRQPHTRVSEAPQGVLPYDTPRDGTLQSLIPGRLQPVISTSTQENLSGNRRESQDVTQQFPHHRDIYRSGERHDQRGGPKDISDERQDPMYAESPLSSMDLHPDWFYRGGPSRCRDSDPTPYSSSHLTGGPPTDFQHDRSNLQLAYQNEGAQPGALRAGMFNVNPTPVPDTLHYRAPSPGIQQYSNQPAPTRDPPQQGRYPLPPSQGNHLNSSYAFHPPVGTFFSGALEEGDVEVPRLYSNHPHHLHQDRRQGPDPLTSSGMVAERHLERDALFPQHEVLDGRIDPNLLLQHGSPFVSQPTPHMEDSFVHLDTPTDLEKVGSVDKDYFVQWVNGFLSHPRRKPPTKPETLEGYSVAEARELIYGALRLVTQLQSLCQTLESRDKGGEPWTKDYENAADIREELEGRLKKLERPGYIQGVKRKLERLRKKRLRGQRRRQEGEEEKLAAERSAEKEASIDLWRMQCIQKVEEKKRERELKAAADQVLGEVRKKKNDVKKMLDVLKSLEKLRKLRKEAAGRKGVCPPPSADETFTNHINRLRTMVHKRSALYDAEEKTLRVILEGEQEEERQRDNDKRLRKLKEKMLQKQRELDDSIFGDTEPLPSLHPLQPFRQYYLQAEHSVVSLVQIRHEWDQFLVPPDHPDGSSIPRGWVVPAPPSNDTWATALKQLD